MKISSFRFLSLKRLIISSNDIMRIELHSKRKTLFFIFSSYERKRMFHIGTSWRCFILWSETACRGVMKWSWEMLQPSMPYGLRRAKSEKAVLWSTLRYVQLKKEHHPYSRQGANFTSDERSDFTSKAIAKRLHKQDFRNWWRCEEKLRFWVKNFYCIKAWREDLRLRWPFFLQKKWSG